MFLTVGPGPRIYIPQEQGGPPIPPRHWVFWTVKFDSRSTEHGRLSHIASELTYRKHHLHHLFDCCVTSPRTRKLRALHSNGCCLQSHLLTTGLYAIVYILTCLLLFQQSISWFREHFPSYEFSATSKRLQKSWVPLIHSVSFLSFRSFVLFRTFIAI
jgi:hypothetical protein